MKKITQKCKTLKLPIATFVRNTPCRGVELSTHKIKASTLRAVNSHLKPQECLLHVAKMRLIN